MPALDLVFLTQTFPRSTYDTAGPFIRDLGAGLVAAGDRVTVLTPHAPGLGKRWSDRGVAVETFRYAPGPFEVLGYGRSLRADEKPRRLAAAVTPLYLAGARRAVRRRLKAAACDLLHAHWVVPNALAAAPAVGHTPFAVGLHGSDVFMAERPIVRGWVRRAMRGCGLLSGCSPELVDRVCALGFDSARSRVIPYGVDVEHFRPGADAVTGWRSRLGVPDEAPLLLGVGRMVTKKGFHVLLDALPELFAAHPDAHLVLAGGGDRQAEFEERSRPWPGRVHFPGSVERDSLPDLYRAADVFVLPAVHDPKGNVDGLPNVILEAMASGLPVVASGISGIPLAIEDGREGRLVPEAEPGPLGAALGDLLGSLDRRRDMGDAARRRVETDLTWKAVAARYREGYVEVLERHRAD